MVGLVPPLRRVLLKLEGRAIRPANDVGPCEKTENLCNRADPLSLALASVRRQSSRALSGRPGNAADQPSRVELTRLPSLSTRNNGTPSYPSPFRSIHKTLHCDVPCSSIVHKLEVKEDLFRRCEIPVMGHG
jgi:hypothetical protein